MGYVRAAREIEQQCESIGLTPARIVTGSGSAGTQAGLVLGTRIPVLGISVSAAAADLSVKIRMLVQEGATLPGFAAAADRPILVNDSFVGDGYGQPTDAMLDALAIVAQLEGIFLDPVYSGKAMAGLIALARQGELAGPTIFLHTGGLPAIFAYDDVI